MIVMVMVPLSLNDSRFMKVKSRRMKERGIVILASDSVDIRWYSSSVVP